MISIGSMQSLFSVSLQRLVLTEKPQISLRSSKRGECYE